MSELIDRIFDAEKISADINLILKELGKVEGALVSFSNQIKEVEATTRKSKGADELAKNAKNLNDTVTKGGVEMKRYEAEVAKLNEKTKQLTDTEKLASIEIAKARLELQAANKATKQAAIEQTLLDARTKGVKDNYSLLKKELESSALAYKNLTSAEQKTAEGKALLAKYWETKKAVNATDEALGNFQHKVGQYEQAMEKLPGIFGEMAATGQSVLVSLRNKFDSVKDATMQVKDALGASREATAAAMAAAEKAAIAEEELATAKRAGAATSSLAAEAEETRAAATVAATVATEASSVAMKVFKYALISTGIGAIVVALGAMVAYFTQTNEGSKEFAKISAGINAVMQSGIKILGSYGKLLFAIATFDLKKIKEGWGEIGNNIKSATTEIGANYKAGVENSAAQKAMAKQEREWSGERLKLLKGYEEARFNAGKKSKLDDEGKIKAAKDALKIDEEIYKKDLFIAKSKAVMIEREQALNSKKDYQAIQDAKNRVQEVINAHAMQQLTVDALLGKAEGRLENSNENIVESEADKNKRILEAKRKLEDMKISLMKESLEKDLKINSIKFEREMEESKNNGKLKNYLLEAQKNEAQKITNSWAAKELNESINADELTLKNMKSAGQNTLLLEKDILNQKMEAEILAGGSKLEIQQKYKFLELNLVAKTADEKAVLFEKELTKQTELLSNGYKKQEIEAKKNYLKSKQTAKDKEKLENELSDIQLNALQEVNQKTIDGLRLQLENSELSVDKRAEFSKKLRDLEIENENAIVNATIKANDDKLKSDEEAKNKRVAIITALANSGAEIFGAIADFQNQQSEQRIAGLEAEQEANNATFEKDQENLDNALMSDETRAEKQKQLNEKKAADDKVIADKIKAEKIKQAKWDKANAIVQAIISTGLAILEGAKQPIPFNIIAMGLASTVGAIQVATIASQPIPAFEKGGITGDGLALWGEARPEVAVTPKGNVMLAEQPTVSDFDAGTRIYKSVADYEASITKNGQAVNFDYDKLANAIPSNEFQFDGNGLLVARDKRGNRRTMINRRYTL